MRFRTILAAAAVIVVAVLVILWWPKPQPDLTPVAAPALSGDAQPVVIDTDMGTDDAMAILFLLGHPGVDVKAIVVVGSGIAHCDAGVENARRLAAMAGRPEIPVACGEEEPLEGSRAYPSFMRSGADEMGSLNLPENTSPQSDRDGVTLLQETIEAHDDVALLALGPLTDVAIALERSDTLIDHLHMIYIMGGAVDVPGNTTVPGMQGGNEYAEFNILIDPTAAKQVFASGAPITLVPLDATNTVPLNTDFMGTLKADRAASPARFVYALLDRNRLFVLSGGYYFWDPLAAGILTDESLATFEDIPLIVETDGEQAGRTARADDGYPIRVAVDADGARFITRFLDVLNGRFSGD